MPRMFGEVIFIMKSSVNTSSKVQLDKHPKCNNCGSKDCRLIEYESAWGFEYDYTCQKCGSNDVEDDDS